MEITKHYHDEIRWNDSEACFCRSGLLFFLNAVFKHSFVETLKDGEMKYKQFMIEMLLQAADKLSGHVVARRKSAIGCSCCSPKIRVTLLSLLADTSRHAVHFVRRSSSLRSSFRSQQIRAPLLISLAEDLRYTAHVARRRFVLPKLASMSISLAL